MGIDGRCVRRERSLGDRASGVGIHSELVTTEVGDKETDTFEVIYDAELFLTSGMWQSTLTYGGRCKDRRTGTVAFSETHCAFDFDLLRALTANATVSLLSL